MSLRTSLCSLVGLSLMTPAIWAADLSAPLAAIKAVGKEGKGNAAAIAAVRQLEKSDPADLPQILAAMDDAGPIARNWIRAAYETVASRPGVKIPQDALLEFLKDHTHLAQARRLAYDTLKAANPAIEGQLIPGMLEDPSGELRRDAVAYAMGEAAKLATDGKKTEAQMKY